VVCQRIRQAFEREVALCGLVAIGALLRPEIHGLDLHSRSALIIARPRLGPELEASPARPRVSLISMVVDIDGQPFRG